MDNQAKPVIGKYVIENLTVGMYDDARCVYREYIQNSADSLDKAIAENMVEKNNAYIHIRINENRRTISFEDNGTGISQKDFVEKLQNVAQSDKEIGKEKGFRGIGRLGGLAYCEELTFETSFKGEAVKSIMIWDAKRLKEIVTDRTQKEEAVEVISSITEFKNEPEEADKHYFKVTMSGVTSEELLNESEIKNYLKMIAPLPFDSHFIFRTKIYDELQKENLSIDEYNIYVNNEQLYKGYTTEFYGETNGKRNKIGEIKDVLFFKAHDRQENLLYWCWHSISNVQNRQLEKVNKSRGLRLRKSNIQIGDENRLEELFGKNPSDTRFQFYVVGEVYALHPDLIPNGRRDDFEDGETYRVFKEKLKPICADIKKLANQASDLASAQRRISKYEEGLKEFEQRQDKGFISQEEQLQLIQGLQTQKKNAEDGKKTIEKVSRTINQQSGETPLAKIFSEVVRNDAPKIKEIKNLSLTDKPLYRADKLDKLSKTERELLKRIFVVIKNVLPSELSENLIQKLEEEFK
ncbi:MAG: ATP-binding protein [Pyrinomonadaceae bacterium]